MVAASLRFGASVVLVSVLIGLGLRSRTGSPRAQVLALVLTVELYQR